MCKKKKNGAALNPTRRLLDGARKAPDTRRVGLIRKTQDVKSMLIRGLQASVSYLLSSVRSTAEAADFALNEAFPCSFPLMMMDFFFPLKHPALRCFHNVVVFMV